MRSKIAATITMDRNLLAQLDVVRKEENQTRSDVINKAVELYLCGSDIRSAYRLGWEEGLQEGVRFEAAAEERRAWTARRTQELIGSGKTPLAAARQAGSEAAGKSNNEMGIEALPRA